MKKQCQFILLPTENPSGITLGLNGILVKDNFFHTAIQNRNEDFQNQHLYFLSDDEIKKGNWFYCSKSNEYIKCYEKTRCEFDKKIIATTNPELLTPRLQTFNDGELEGGIVSSSVAKISPSDIEYIISLYNGKSKEVEVDIENIFAENFFKYMRENNVEGFKRAYRTLYNKVIIPSMKQCLQDNAGKKFTLDDISYAIDLYTQNYHRRRNSLSKT